MTSVDNSKWGIREKAGFAFISLVILSALVFFFILEPIPQDIEYHRFADQDPLAGIPNFWNVVSNLVFLWVGVLGLYKLVKGKTLSVIPAHKSIYLVFFIGVALVAFGSAYYHVSPDNPSLVWDRLPMTIAFMSFFSIMMSEFISVRAGKYLFLPMVLCGVLSVLYWAATEARGVGDLRVYLLVQFIPLISIPIILLFFKSCFNRVYGFWGLFIAYSLAKVFEVYDGEIFDLLGVISGHSLKHVASALGVYILLISFEKRRLAG